MDNTQIKQYIDNVNINIETPSDDSDIGLQALERDNWGKILNDKTFKIEFVISDIKVLLKV